MNDPIAQGLSLGTQALRARYWHGQARQVG